MIDKSSKDALKVRVITIAALAFTMVLLMIFGNHPQAVERYYSKGLYTFICRILHPVFDLFPFSVGDIVYISIIIYLLSLKKI